MQPVAKGLAPPIIMRVKRLLSIGAVALVPAFTLTPARAVDIILHDFTDTVTDGSAPEGSLTVAGSKLYGMTSSGGTVDAGTVFSMNTNGTGFGLLHSFSFDNGDGRAPNGTLTLSGSTLYGTATFGGGGGDAGTNRALRPRRERCWWTRRSRTMSTRKSRHG